MGDAAGFRKFINRRVFNMRRDSTTEPNLSDLIVFIDEETTFLDNPLFSRDAVSRYPEKKEKYDHKKNISTFLAKNEI